MFGKDTLPKLNVDRVAKWRIDFQKNGEKKKEKRIVDVLLIALSFISETAYPFQFNLERKESRQQQKKNGGKKRIIFYFQETKFLLNISLFSLCFGEIHSNEVCSVWKYLFFFLSILYA